MRQEDWGTTSTRQNLSTLSGYEFLGITLDAEGMEARLPEEKLAKGRRLLEEFLTRQKVTLRDLQSLIGVLNLACTVIVPGRAFLRRLIDMTMGVQKPYHHIRLTRQAKYDLKLQQFRAWAP